MPDVLIDALVKGGTPTVILGFGIYILWKTYLRKDAENSALTREVMRVTESNTNAVEALIRKLDGRGRRGTTKRRRR